MGEVVISDLPHAERQLFLELLISEGVKLERQEDGSYTGRISLVWPKPKADAKKQRGMVARMVAGKTGTLARRASRPPDEMKRIVGALNSSKALFDFAVYPTFSSLISQREALKPRKRPLSWVMRLVEEVYDARYAYDTADLREGGGDGGGGGGDGSRERLSQLFPVYVVDHFSKKFGLRSIVDQQCWDLLYNVHAMRKDTLQIEVFARFLQEYYDPDDLLFFLYVRSCIQKELNVNFRNCWAEATRSDGAPGVVWMTYRDCLFVSREVFGSESDPMFRAFMSVVTNNMQGRARKRKDTRRIEVQQFLHLALVEYHETRPPDDGDVPLVTGEQQALFAAAEEDYEASMRRLGADPSSHAAAAAGRTHRPGAAFAADGGSGDGAAAAAVAGSGRHAASAPSAAAPFASADDGGILDDAVRRAHRIHDATESLAHEMQLPVDLRAVAAFLQAVSEDQAMVSDLESQLRSLSISPDSAAAAAAAAGAGAGAGTGAGIGAGAGAGGDGRHARGLAMPLHTTLSSPIRAAAPSSARAAPPSTAAAPLAAASSPEEVELNRLLLKCLGEAMHACSEAYLDNLLSSAALLPPAVVSEIRNEASLQLSHAVDAMLGRILSDGGDADEEPTEAILQLRRSFHVLTLQAQRCTADSLRDELAPDLFAFAQTLLQTEALRGAIEPTVSMLITYAEDGLKSAGDAPPPAR
eukprot:PLAT5035.9.p1 GENE.PLAT5035.9~~PLAT5035.9.p1  ORF type:complete len:721 (+),score=335.59 PLAT5035.9:72-2165(+)